MPGGHLIEDGSKREQIAPCIQFLRSRLLRRHISHGAERRTGAGEMMLVDRFCQSACRRTLARRTGCGRDLRQAEIENFGVSAFGDENIGRLYVAMNDGL